MALGLSELGVRMRPCVDGQPAHPGPLPICRVLVREQRRSAIEQRFDIGSPGGVPSKRISASRASRCIPEFLPRPGQYQRPPANPDLLRHSGRRPPAESALEFQQALTGAGVDHSYMEIEGPSAQSQEMLSRYRPIWFDYRVESILCNAR